MSILKLRDPISLAGLKKGMEAENNIRFFKHWQILNAVANNPGIKANTLAKILGVSTGIIYRTVELYNKWGSAFKNLLQWGGRRESRSILAFGQESALLKSVEARSLKGEILTAKEIRKEVEKQAGRHVSDDYLWDLFKRHGWKKKVPRPKHPNHNPAVQEAFKKNFPMQWQPPS
jgi:transposase